jgi:hypothetical protein
MYKTYINEFVLIRIFYYFSPKFKLFCTEHGQYLLNKMNMNRDVITVHEICALQMFHARLNRTKHALRRRRSVVAKKAVSLTGTYVYLCTCDTCIYTYTCRVYVLAYLYTYLRIYLCIYVCLYAYIYEYEFLHTCMYTYKHMYMFISMSTYDSPLRYMYNPPGFRQYG